MPKQISNTPCPCGSTTPYSDCCQPLHKGDAAATPEALMRSRYAAFVKNLPEYLKATWHPDTRPASLDLQDSPDWISLHILNSSERGDQGNVHFRAVHRLSGGFCFLEERSAFQRLNGRWYYLQGETSEGQLKPGRNDPCPCGSGKKYKSCCL